MCLAFHTRAVHFFPMLKEKSVEMKFLITFTKKKKKIRGAQNWYTAVQIAKIALDAIDLKLGT